MDKEKIINIVCEVCGLQCEDIRLQSKKTPLPAARALIAHFLQKELKMTPRQISPLIGHRGYDRTSVYHYLKRITYVEERSPVERDLREKAERIQSIIDDKKHPD